MNGKTYYMILGVSRAESPGGIRAAYRDLAKKLHPDVAGQQATHAFQEISEAYDVLSDPQRRREYEKELRRVESSGGAPIRPGPAAPIARAPVSIFDATETVRPSFEAMYDRHLRNVTGVGTRKSEHLEGLNVEVVLTHEEARQGGVLSIGVPGIRCPYCGGSGCDWLFPCLSCQQQGMIEDEEIICIRIPAMARSGSIYEMPLQGLGIHNFHLRLHVFVEPQSADERR
jgi:DnaJ-class molecular chaperone